MQDRIPVNPGRVLITPENGSAAYYATMTRADNPTQEGTPLNKSSLLKDTTAALFGLGADAVPNDVFAAVKTLIDSVNANADTRAKIATGSYTGAGTYGSRNKNRLVFDFVPRVVIVVVNTTSWEGAGTVFVNGQTKNAGLGINYNRLSLELTVAWSGNEVQWYHASSDNYQLNSSDIKYYYAAIG